MAKVKRDMSEVKCLRCHQFGHYKRNCPKARGRGRHGGQGAGDKMALAAVVVQENDIEQGDQDGGKALHAVNMQATARRRRVIRWVLDTGASHHILSDVSIARDVRSCDIKVQLANGKAVSAAGVGKVDVITEVGRRLVHISLSDVLIVPEAPHNLLSGRAAMAKGIDIDGKSSSQTILLRKEGRVMGVAAPEKGLNILTAQWPAPHGETVDIPRSNKKVEALAARFQDEAKLWHQRLGHLSYGTMARMVRDKAVTGMKVTAAELQAKTRKTCKTCVLAKHAADPHPESNSRAKAPLALIHSDLMGPMKPKSAGGNVYILTAVDDYSGYAQIVPLKHKNEASGALKKVLLGWERQLDMKVKKVRTDRGTEYFEFNRWCESQGILHERSVAYTPQQNGRAERFNRTITQKARAMLLDAGIALKFWAEAFSTATVVYNLSPRLSQPKTPYEMFWGMKPDVSHLRIFGCLVYCQKPSNDRKKLSSWSKEGRFMGYDAGTKGWRVLLSNGKMAVRFNVKFIEDTAAEEEEDISDSEDDEQAAAAPHNEAPHVDEAPDDMADHEDAENANDQGAGDVLGQEEAAVEIPQKRHLPRRARAPSKRLRDAYAFIATDGLSDDPDVETALKQSDAEQWHQAMKEEM